MKPKGKKTPLQVHRDCMAYVIWFISVTEQMTKKKITNVKWFHFHIWEKV